LLSRKLQKTSSLFKDTYNLYQILCGSEDFCQKDVFGKATAPPNRAIEKHVIVSY
jgi:hypothetical protein